MTRAIRVAVSCVAVCAMAHDSFAQDCTQIAAQYRLATVRIDSRATNTATGEIPHQHGSGVIVSSEGHVLTNSHLMHFGDAFNDLIVEGSIGSTNATAMAMRILDIDRSRDVALLQFANSSRTYEFVPFPNAVVTSRGMSLCSLSYPLDVEFSIARGILSAKSGPDGTAWWTVDMPTHPGDSGSPVFTQQGALLGVRVAGRTDTVGMHYLIPINLAHDLVCSHVNCIRPGLFYPATVNWLVAVGFTDGRINPRLPRDLVHHENHADDGFLSGAAGTTDLADVTIRGVELEAGIAYRPARANFALISEYVLKLDASSHGRLEIQQVNDPRPATSGSFVYSQLRDLSPGHALRTGAAAAWRVSTGAEWWIETQGLIDIGRWSATFEKGWSRFGRDQVALASEANGLELSPRVRLSVVTSAWGVHASLVFTHIRFDHQNAHLGSSNASGISIGLGGKVMLPQRRP